MVNKESNNLIIVKIIFEILKGIFYCAVPIYLLFVGITSHTKDYILEILMILLTIWIFIAYTNWIKIIGYIKEINIPEEF